MPNKEIHIIQSNSTVDINERIGFGGGCHWCTEGVFNTLNGIEKVEQGWISSLAPHNTPSEAIIVHFDSSKIDMHTLISIHLYTHSCTSNHSFREKYRSAIYYFSNEQNEMAIHSLNQLKNEFELPIITQVLPFDSFKLNTENYLDYLYTRPQGSFCESSIYPKLRVLLNNFKKHVNHQKLEEHQIKL